MAKGARGYARFAKQMAVFCTVFPSNGGHCRRKGVPQELGISAISFTARPASQGTCVGLKLGGSFVLSNPTTNLSLGGYKWSLYS